MANVLWISAVGGSLLFFALTAVVGLMYLLTAPWLFPADKAEAEAEAAPPAEDAGHAAEHDRRRRAVALAVAVACAGDAQMLTVPADTSGEWRHLGRARQLARSAVRRRTR